MTKVPALRRTLSVTELPIDALSPYPNNARVHSKAQLRKIATSLMTWSWTNPILIDENRMILCGHGRWLAARQLGMTHVPTIMLDDMTEADKKAYILADNVLADKAGYSKKLLAIELQGLIDVGFEVELTGYDTVEIDRLLILDDDRDPGDPIELPREGAMAISQEGDLWQIGPHRLLVGDALNRLSYERLLEGRLAQMIFTDPPYNVPIAGNVSGLGRKTHDEFAMASGEMTDAEFANQFLRPVFRHLAANAQNGAICFACIDWRHAPQMVDAAAGIFSTKNLIVWVKTNAGMGSFYRSQHELIYAFKVGKAAHINNFGLGERGRHRSNVWTYAGANTFRSGRAQDLADHPTVKPRKLVMDAIEDVSKRNGLVLDPFAGAGTTLIAAARTGRIGAGIEIEPGFADVIIRNLERETGQPAKLADGTSFAEATEKRASTA